MRQVCLGSPKIIFFLQQVCCLENERLLSMGLQSVLEFQNWSFFSPTARWTQFSKCVEEKNCFALKDWKQLLSRIWRECSTKFFAWVKGLVVRLPFLLSAYVWPRGGQRRLGLQRNSQHHTSSLPLELTKEGWAHRLRYDELKLSVLILCLTFFLKNSSSMYIMNIYFPDYLSSPFVKPS